MESQMYWKARLSFKNATIVVCFLNFIAFLLLMQGFFASPKRGADGGHQMDPDPPLVCKMNLWNFKIIYIAAQIRYILESEEIRRAMEPLELIKRIKEIEQEAHTQPDHEIQQVPKQNAAVDLAKRLRDRAMNDASSQQALEEWRKRKMERARQREIEKNITTAS
ncbi:hypothetical protein ZIOFF_012432 [Zingiber officinale]|uniref:Transmembrane protein n=1 Tax=Zingiber officinale TaxID=94328 RepID=A0A8J5M3E4_ZINOF|nr:hypothetical protein ZIOFF_012432 [Zingiber officinale]